MGSVLRLLPQKKSPAEAGPEGFPAFGGRRPIAGGRIDRIGIHVWLM
jgi:hypothetical protein